MNIKMYLSLLLVFVVGLMYNPRFAIRCANSDVDNPM
jgi:hypothetical protein